MKNIHLTPAWKRAWGKRNEWSLQNGNEYFPKLRGAEVYEWNESAMKYQESAEGTEWSENGNHILQAHGQSTRYVFYFLDN